MGFSNWEVIGNQSRSLGEWWGQTLDQRELKSERGGHGGMNAADGSKILPLKGEERGKGAEGACSCFGGVFQGWRGLDMLKW